MAEECGVQRVELIKGKRVRLPELQVKLAVSIEAEARELGEMEKTARIGEGTRRKPKFYGKNSS